MSGDRAGGRTAGRLYHWIHLLRMMSTVNAHAARLIVHVPGTPEGVNRHCVRYNDPARAEASRRPLPEGAASAPAFSARDHEPHDLTDAFPIAAEA